MSIPTFNPLKLLLPAVFALALPALGQDKRPTTPPSTTPPAGTGTTPSAFSALRSNPKPYKEVITDKAITRKGLFTIHKVDEKWYFEIPDSLLGREILVVNRLIKAAAGMGGGFVGYAGDQIGNSVITFEKGPSHKVFLKRTSYEERSKDSTQEMYTAVINSNLQPIVAAFDIAAYNRDSTGTIIDMTTYINGDNDVLHFGTRERSAFQVGSQQLDKSYIETVRPYPLNIEIKTLKTYTKSAGGGFGAGAPGGISLLPSTAGQLLTMELNSSLVLLPAKPMQTRYFDPRVGFFQQNFTSFDANPQGVKSISDIVRWKLEPKDEDIEKYKRGELVEPKKQIVYYIDPATPKKWVPYLIQGVNDWQVAFEKAGFKNAIVAKVAPTKAEDSTWSLEDARYSAIVYKPSEVENASGPNVHDPRTGEILESHINWYHNVMELLRNWYFIQASPSDPRARKMQFDDQLMGDLIRFVSSHEVGHTLGLRHNYGSSSTVPVEKLRDKAFVEANGHTPSIMDYARFNYVAQPEDSIKPAGLYPRIGDYDKWAIEWGYRLYYQYDSPDAEAGFINKMTTERLAANKRLFFGTEINPDDPREQNEDLGDNAMKAGAYGIKNLQRIVPNLLEWTKMPNENYDNLKEMYNEVLTQFNRYMGHAMKNIGGIYQNPKKVEVSGPVYEYVPKATQQEAMAFLAKNILNTPTWLINRDIYDRIDDMTPVTTIGARMEAVMNGLLSTARMGKLINAEAELGSSAYTLTDLMDDVKKNIWTELSNHKAIDVYRRNLQKAYVERMAALVAPPAPGTGSFGGIVFTIGPAGPDVKRSDIMSVAKGTLRSLKSEIAAAIPGTTDKLTKYHLQDMQERIDRILNPKN